MRFIDNHTHTQFSPDSTTTVGELARRAVETGAAGIAFTDHLDLAAPRQADLFVFDLEAQRREIERVAAVYGRDVRLLRGIEIGMQPCCLDALAEVTARGLFDTVIASIHFVDGLDPYYGDYYRGKSDFRKAYGRVLELIYATAAEFKDFDIIGHFDYVARYAPYEVRDIRYTDFPDELDAVLKYLAENGKALEINTKTYSLQKGGHVQQLDKTILTRFRELGGEAVSLGSDSHDAQRLCDRFGCFWEVVKSAGFSRLVYFDRRKPVFYDPEKI